MLCLGPPCAEGFEGGFFCSEAGGIAFGAELAGAVGIGAFTLSKAAMSKALAMFIDHAGDAGDFDDVDAVSDDSHG
jgi:hypothetical protein